MNPPTSEPENRSVELSARGPKLRVSALLCLVLGSCTIDEVLPVTWDFSFRCEAEADRTEFVELKVAKGPCPVGARVVFETASSTWGTPVTRPQGLPAGLYAFQGTAWDADGQPIASHCESVEIPAKKVINLNLQGAFICGDDTSQQDAGPWEDDWEDDDDFTDAGLEDGGVEFDAGEEECVDGGSDRDDDGVTDCIDECPDDSAKTSMGQCGCGTADLDQDDDGTANCVDLCPLNPSKTAPGQCGCTPRTRLGPSETLTLNQYLCVDDDNVRFGLEADGRLHLRMQGVELWVNSGEPGVFARMQGDGNLVIRIAEEVEGQPVPPSAWSSGTVYYLRDSAGNYILDAEGKKSVGHGRSFLDVHADGKVTISSDGKVVWTIPQL